MSDMLDFKQSRKWQITINNPQDHDLDHDTIMQIMSTVKGKSLYWCMCDEEGDECETRHTHIFLYRSSPFTARQINTLFPNMHRTTCYGTAAENRAYVLKDGEKYHKDENGHYDYTDSAGKKHQGINFSDTFYEYGECPAESQGKSKDSDIITAMIKDGYTNEDIVDAVSSAYKDLEKIERVRSMYRDSRFRDNWRDLQVTYIFGKTGSGKTRSVMEAYGYLNCYRVTDYSSYERGSNENANRIIRRYFPKGQSLYHVTQQQCQDVADAMNRMHRKILNYSTAQELFDDWQTTLKSSCI